MDEQDGWSATCRVCRGPIEQKKRGRPRTTCGTNCRSAAYRRRKGQPSRSALKAQREQRKLEALPLTERVMDVDKDQPLYIFADGRRLYRCLTCSKVYETKRQHGDRHRRYCSDACEEKAKYHWHKLIDAYEVLHQQHSRASWPIRRRIEEGKLSPLCPQCGKPFEPNFGKPGRPRKYCGKACRKAAYERRWRSAHGGKPRPHRYADCPVCGERFDRTDTLGRITRKYCSRRCSQYRRDEKRRLRQKGLLPPAKRAGGPTIRRVKRRRQAEREPLMGGWKRVRGFVTYVGEQSRGQRGGVEHKRES